MDQNETLPDGFDDLPPIDYFEDAPSVENAAPATLERLSILAQNMRDLEQEIADDTTALAEKQAKLEKLERVTVPGIMAELAITEMKLQDGSEIAVKNELKCGITEVNKPRAFAWLRTHDFDGIIKCSVSSDFGKNESDKAAKAVEVLRAAGFDAAMAESVHHSTLKSFVKEQLEEGNAELPLEVFGVFEYKVAKIKLPKRRK